MDIFQVIRDRRSIRKYKETPVEADKIEQILDAARLAPSWKNMQCWRFLVVSDPEQKRRSSQPSLRRIRESGDRDRTGRNRRLRRPGGIGVENGIDYYIADTAIAFEHLCLAAHALGLGTCWMGWFDEAAIRTPLAIPKNIRVIGITPWATRIRSRNRVHARNLLQSFSTTDGSKHDNQKRMCNTHQSPAGKTS